MDFWTKVKGDLQKGVKEGMEAVREGATAVRKKTEELTEEGKKRLKIYDLKRTVQREIAELGGRIYDLKTKTRNPYLDSKVKATMARIKRLEDRIAKLEGKAKEAVKKRAPGKKA
jgi:polyhydroxyalkanoate synthesis regulator phasin